MAKKRKAEEDVVLACRNCGRPQYTCQCRDIDGAPVLSQKMPRSKAIEKLRGAIENAQDDVNRLQAQYREYTGHDYDVPNM